MGAGDTLESVAHLARRGDGATFPLCDETLVGRSRAVDLRLDEAFASGLHASLHFGDAGWEIRDLGSRNGTLINGEGVERGGSRSLTAGDAIAFGDARQTWVLEVADEPVPLALTASGTIAQGRDGLLPLPSADDPLVTVVRDAKGGWLVEDDGGDERRPVEDRETIVVRGETWTLRVPHCVTATRSARRWNLDKALVSMRPPDVGEIGALRVEQDNSTTSFELGSAGSFVALLVEARTHAGQHSMMG